MRKLPFILLFLSFSSFNYSQSLKIGDILDSVYENRLASVIEHNKEIDVFVSPTDKFIDTTQINSKKNYYRLLYFYNDTSFESHLKKTHKAVILTLEFDEIKFDEMSVTINVSMANEKGYFGKYKVVVYYDKKDILLKFDQSKQQWEYRSIIKEYKDL